MRGKKKSNLKENNDDNNYTEFAVHTHIQRDTRIITIILYIFLMYLYTYWRRRQTMGSSAPLRPEGTPECHIYLFATAAAAAAASYNIISPR